jgi:hypothetical protein
VKDIFDNKVVPGAIVAVSRQVGYSVSQYAATVEDAYEDKHGANKVRVKYHQTVWGVPAKPQVVGLDKVVVIPQRPSAGA